MSLSIHCELTNTIATYRKTNLSHSLTQTAISNRQHRRRKYTDQSRFSVSMRTSTLLSILPFLAYTSARVIHRPDHRAIIDNLSARGDYFAPEHDEDETLIKIINEPGSSGAQYLSYDGSSFTAFSTSVYGASTTGLPKGFNLANKNVVKGDQSRVDQLGAASYEADHQPDIDPAIVGGGGTVPQEEVEEWLRVHNNARGAHGAGKLEWSEELAKGAKSNAEQCKGEHT